MKIEIIAATRHSDEDFWSKSALGMSIRRLSYDDRLILRIFTSNTRGLPHVYNDGISAADPLSIVVMVHDDVWIDDYFIHKRINEGLASYDVIGVAGNRRRVPGQPAWAFPSPKLEWDDKANLSGAFAWGQHPFGAVSNFGEPPADCELLDGMFLAARRSVLTDKKVFFDARFDFHFYDMDFCRSARLKGLRLGTWPICLTHQSGGSFGSEPWQKGYQTYLEKWGA